MSEILLSSVQTFQRTDSDFFSSQYLKLEKLLSQNENKKLDELCKLHDGPFGSDILADSYEETGLPVLRMQSISSKGTLKSNNMIFLSDDVRKSVSKYIAKSSDVVVTKVGFLGYSTVLPDTYPEYFFRREITRCEILEKSINPYYLSSFFNSKYGRSQSIRFASGTTRDRVLLGNQKEFLIPIFSRSFQKEIEKICCSSYSVSNKSKSTYAQAEQTLLEELGLADFTPSNDPVNIKSFSDSFATSGRLDAEYYQKKYDDAEQTILNYKNGCFYLQEKDIRDKNFTPQSSKEYRYIELSNIGNAGCIESCTIDHGQNLPSRARRKVQTGDVIVSSIEGSLSSSALVTQEYDNALCSTGFFVLQPKELKSETLLILVKSPVMQSLLKRICKGTILTAFGKSDLKYIPLPKIEDTTQQTIAALVENSFTLKHQSEHLLDVAKRAVEIAIEQNEGAATAYIDQHIK